LVARKGKVAYYEPLAFRIENKIPMARNSIFRAASMTKPFTSLSIMMLAEEENPARLSCLPLPAGVQRPEGGR
jgi:CubicO group peptidase (beta-lactamase class C family)